MKKPKLNHELKRTLEKGRRYLDDIERDLLHMETKSANIAVGGLYKITLELQSLIMEEVIENAIEHKPKI